MHDDSPTAEAVAQDAAIDRAIMGLLLIDHPGMWSVLEVERAMNDPLAATDGLSRLTRSGLIHRLDGGFVCATRSAAHAAEIRA